MSIVKTDKLSKKEEKLQAKTMPVVYTPLDVLLSNMREPELIDTWSPREIAILIASISKHGESLSDIAPYFPAKTIDDLCIFIRDVFNKTRFSSNK